MKNHDPLLRTGIYTPVTEDDTHHHVAATNGNTFSDETSLSQNDHDRSGPDSSHTGSIRSSDNNVLSLEEAMDRIGHGPFQRRLLVAAGLCSASDAMEILVLSFLSLSVQEEWNLSTGQTSTLISSVFVGALGGTLLLGRLGDVRGRRPTFIVTAALVAVFGLLSATCRSYRQLVFTRAMVGVGIGGVTVPFDTYGECLPPSCRGKGLVYPSYFWTAGTLLVVLGAQLTLQEDGSGGGWRYLCLWCAVPCIVATLVGYLVVPESPQWLLAHSQTYQATTTVENGGQPTSASSLGLRRTILSMEQEQALTILRRAAVQNGKDPDHILPLGTLLVLVANYSVGTADDDDENDKNSCDGVASAKVESQQLDSFHNDYSRNHQTTMKEDCSETNMIVQASSSSVWDLLSPHRLKSSLAILSIWFGSALLFYGTILAITAVFTSSTTTTSSASSASASSQEDQQQYHGAGGHSFDYGAILFSSLAELAATTFLILTIDRWGRRILHALSFGLGGILVCGLCWVAAASSSSSSLSSSSSNDTNDEQDHYYHQQQQQQQQHRLWSMALAFGARFWVFSGSVITWIWTAEVLETKHRTTGHGMANAGGRVGGFLSPYLVSGTTSYFTIGLVLWITSWTWVTIAWSYLPETLGAPMGGVILLRDGNYEYGHRQNETQQKRSLELTPRSLISQNLKGDRHGKKEYRPVSSSSSQVV